MQQAVTPSETPCAEIDLAALVENWRRLSALAPNTETGAVVKANAYGLGMPEVAKALANAGCRTFFTAYASEGSNLRAVLGEGPEIVVFNGPSRSTLNTFQESQCTPVLNSNEQVSLWRQSGPKAPVYLHIDTGMNRLGLRATGFETGLADDLDISCIMSHLACADTPAHEMNARQLVEFVTIAAHYPNARKSLCNTAGICLGEDYQFDLTRPGIGLYGGFSSEGYEPLPVVHLTAPIIATYDVKEAPPFARKVGYGSEYEATPGDQIAVVSLGYADGFFRSFFETGFCMVGSHRCPVIGRVSMDLIAIDITNASREINAGDSVEILGANANIEEQAKAAGTLSYELLTAMGPRITRQYVGSNESLEKQNS